MTKYKGRSFNIVEILDKSLKVQIVDNKVESKNINTKK